MPDTVTPNLTPPPCTVLRPAGVEDLEGILAVEQACFTTDHLTRRAVHHLLTRGQIASFVELAGARVVGFIVVLFHRGTTLARLYALAVDPDWQSLGIGGRLLAAAEHEARRRHCRAMRLEVRRDNPAAQALYRRHGYHQFGTYANYYQDHMDALRLDKPLAARPLERPGPGGASGLRSSVAGTSHYRADIDHG